MHKCVNNSDKDVGQIEQLIGDFFPYSQKSLGFNKPVTIVFQSDSDNATKILGKTAYYDPTNLQVVLYTDNRHPKDIMRSLSHELVHHAQNCRGDFTSTDATYDGYAQDDPHLRKMEREAYTKGNLIFRDFEDLIKTGKINVETDLSNPGEPKMSLKEWKNNEINTKLMKKWGLLKEEKNEPADVATGDDELAGEEAGEDAAEDLEEGCGDYRDEDEDLEEGFMDKLKSAGAAVKSAGQSVGKAIDNAALKTLPDDKAERLRAKWDREDASGAVSRQEEGFGWRDEDQEKGVKRHVAGGHPDVADFIMPNAPKGKAPPPGQRIMDPRFLKDKTTKVAPVAVPGDDELDTRTRHLNRTKDGKLVPAVRDPEHPDAIRRENQKISVREAKEITRRIIERIKKEGK